MTHESPSSSRRYFLVGGAGFIGSHFTDRLLRDASTEQVTLYDNFSSGRRWHYAHHESDSRLSVVHADVKDFARLKEAMEGHDTVIHFASNPDIARAAVEPDIDFREGTVLTNNVVEAMRQSKTAKRILYTSGSGIYGELGEHAASEDHGPLVPVSTYGASKLAGETLISAYAYMFDLQAVVFRFGNVVGPRQTHGVGFDFAKRLLANPNELTILGDGTQSKSYVYVEDVVAAVLLAHASCRGPFFAFNVATGDYITVAEIAHVACASVGLDPANVHFRFGSTPRGWKGDVPIVRLNTDKIRALGWQNKRNSREAIQDSILAMLPDLQAGRLT
jgi:UDP-glucose 4-epimerase